MDNRNGHLQVAAIKQLALTNWRELIRDRAGFFLMMFFPFLFFGLMVLVDLSGDGLGELGKMMLPFTLVLSFWFLAFYSLGFQTVQLRQRGTLRLLGLTPVTRLTWILAQLPPRLCLAILQLGGIAVLSLIMGYLNLDRLHWLLSAGVIGVLMMFSLAYFVGGLLHSPEAALVIPAGLLPLVLFPSGLLLPLDAVPRWMVEIGKYSPFTYWADLIKYSLLGTPLQQPWWLNLSVLVVTTLLFTWLTARTFKWDQRED